MKRGQVLCVCWHCGESHRVTQDGELQVVADVYAIAKRAGMLVAKDDDGQRVLLFCDDICRDRNLTGGEFDTLQPNIPRAGRIVSAVYLL